MQGVVLAWVSFWTARVIFVGTGHCHRTVGHDLDKSAGKPKIHKIVWLEKILIGLVLGFANFKLRNWFYLVKVKLVTVTVTR